MGETENNLNAHLKSLTVEYYTAGEKDEVTMDTRGAVPETLGNAEVSCRNLYETQHC